MEIHKGTQVRNKFNKGESKLTVDAETTVDSGPKEIKVLYIGGSSRSGTGILGRVFSRISGVAHGGELRRLWSHGLRPGRPCDCGRPHADCPVWSKLLVPGATYLEPSLAELASVQEAAAPETHAWWNALKILSKRSSPEASSAKARYCTLYTDLYKAFARATGSSVILDNSKNPSDAALLAEASDITVYSVQIVRDPRGVLFSHRKRSTPDNPGRAQPIETMKYAVYWMLRQITFDSIRRRYGPDRSLLVIYEQLMEDPNQVLEAACRLLGEDIPADKLQLGVPLQMPEVHGPDGSGRFSPTQVVLRADDRWRRELHLFDRLLMTFLTFPFLLRYGYPIWKMEASHGDKTLRQGQLSID